MDNAWILNDSSPFAGLCLISYFAPCYVSGKNAEAVGESCILYGILALVAPVNIVTNALIRGKIRDHQNIEGSLVGDICVYFFCFFCALVQDAQEVKEFSGAGMAIERDWDKSWQLIESNHQLHQSDSTFCVISIEPHKFPLFDAFRMHVPSALPPGFNSSYFLRVLKPLLYFILKATLRLKNVPRTALYVCG